MTLIHPVLLSGGAGTRLWPLSRAAYPKQFLPLTSEHSLLQETALRLSATEFAPPLVICNDEHRFIIAEQLRAAGITPAHIVLEPAARNTAPAAAIAALMLARDVPGALILLVPSDHAIDDSAGLRTTILAAAPLAAAGRLVTFGVVPNVASSAYGYIRRGVALGAGAFVVDAFIEKPDGITATAYLESGAYLWNSGLFLFSAPTMIAALAAHRPAMLAQCRKALDSARDDLDFLRLERAPFEAIKGESLDYAVMEHTTNAAVVPLEIGWSDVGSWQALRAIAAKDVMGNVAIGDTVLEGCRNSYVRSEGPLVVALGLDEAAVIATGDAVLVAKLDVSDGVGGIVERLARRGRSEALGHPTVHRPWGSFTAIKTGPRYKVKLLRVMPGAALSLQYHNRRAEHWVVVGGEARITRADETIALKPDQSLYVPVGTPHRLANPGAEPLEVIEVQTGDYLEEDDIVRLDDHYGR